MKLRHNEYRRVSMYSVVIGVTPCVCESLKGFITEAFSDALVVKSWSFGFDCFIVAHGNRSDIRELTAIISAMGYDEK